MAQVVCPADACCSDDQLRREQAVSHAVPRAAVVSVRGLLRQLCTDGSAVDLHGNVQGLQPVWRNRRDAGWAASNCASFHNPWSAGHLCGYEQCVDAELLLRRAEEDLLDASGADELVPASSRRATAYRFLHSESQDRTVTDNSPPKRQATKPMGFALPAWDWGGCSGVLFESGAHECGQECDLLAASHPRNLVCG